MITLKYADPKQVFRDTEAFAGNPPLEGGIANAYADLEAIQWIEEDIKVNPSVPTEMDLIWVAMYRAIREGVAYPISVAEGVSVIKIIEDVKRNTPFAPTPAGAAAR